MVDLKRTPVYKKHPHKPMGLMRGFIFSCVWAAFMGFVIGCVLTAIRTGHFLP